MDWTIFGNVVNILAALVTIGAPVFAIVRAIMHSRKSHTTRSHAALAPRMPEEDEAKERTIPWYIWMKVVGKTLITTLNPPTVILLYWFLAILLLVAITAFCFLVGIPANWTSQQGGRLLLLSALLIFSLHYSITFAEYADGFFHAELQKRQARILRMRRSQKMF